MSNNTNVTAISAVGSSSSPQIADLQEQMSLYTDMANSANAKASADYRTLQSALASGNVIAAEVALIELQRTSETTAGSASAPVPAETAAAPAGLPQNTPPPPTLNTIA